MSEAVILREIDDRGIATVRFNRPRVNNAYNEAMLEALVAACAGLADDDAVRVLVIRGSGRHFQAGADLTWLQAIGRMDAAANVRASRLTAQAVHGLYEFPKPTVALVHGACVGGGTGLVASCDIAIASADATFAVSEARWGVVASIIFPQLNAAMGVRHVRRYALSCERFDAAKAKNLGLIHEVCAAGALDQAAAGVLEGLLQAAPESVAITKRSAARCAGALVTDEELERLVQEHALKRQSSEAAEGFHSFTERRQARWYPGTGRAGS